MVSKPSTSTGGSNPVNRYGTPHQRPTFGKGGGAQYQTHLTGPAASVGAKKPGMGSWQSRFGANRYTKPVSKPTPARPQWQKPVTTRKPFTTLKPTPKPTTRATTMNRWSPTKPRTTTRTTTRFSFMASVMETTEPFIPTTQPVAQVNFNQNLFAQRTTTRPTTTTTTFAGPVLVNECLTGTHRCDPEATCFATGCKIETFQNQIDFLSVF